MFGGRNLWRVAIAALCLWPLAARADDGPGFESTVFDKPLELRSVDLGPTETVPVARKEVRCAYYPAAMVKVVDEHEVGAAQLSILPVAAGQPRPTCQRANVPGEVVIDAKLWSGYFAGSASGYAVFSAADGVNGGMAFAIFSLPDAKLVFSGAAKGPLQFDSPIGPQLAVHYQKLHAAKCSVVVKRAACAKMIARETGVAAVAVKLCKRGYADQKRDMARMRCEAQNRRDAACVDKGLRGMKALDSAPSVIAYPVTLRLTATGGAERAVGKPSSCWPSD